jgi:hypothetical protein
MPTLARGQLAKMCFAVDSDADAEFGLSQRQDDNPAVSPGLWANCDADTVGMAYLDAPSIDTPRAGRALRTWNWASDTSAIRAHAETFSAASRPADPITARFLLGGDPTGTANGPVRESATVAVPGAGAPADRTDDVQEDGEMEELDGDPIAEHVRSADPNPEIQAGPDDEIDDDGYDGWQFEKPVRPIQMSTEDARALLEGQLSQWFRADRTHFRPGDLRPVWESAGRGRAWSGRYLREHLLPAGVIAEDDERGGYVIVRDPQDEREPAGV